MQPLQNWHGLSHSHGSNLLFEDRDSSWEKQLLLVLLWDKPNIQRKQCSTRNINTISWVLFGGLIHSLDWPLDCFLWKPWNSVTARIGTLNRMHHCLPKQTTDTSGVLTSESGWDWSGRRHKRNSNSGQPFRTTKGSQMPTAWYFDRNLNKDCFQQLLHFPLLTAVLTPYSQGMACTTHFRTLIFPC